MLVLSEGDASMRINYISSRSASECSYVMVTSAVLGNLIITGTQKTNHCIMRILSATTQVFITSISEAYIFYFIPQGYA